VRLGFAPDAGEFFLIMVALLKPVHTVGRMCQIGQGGSMAKLFHILDDKEFWTCSWCQRILENGFVSKCPYCGTDVSKHILGFDRMDQEEANLKIGGKY
jgi:hypothetical protein